MKRRMSHLLSNRIAHTLCMVAICFSLVACNEEREKKVLAQTDEAAKTVQAQKAAADLANTAQQLLASPGRIVNTADLKTIECGVGAARKVVSYIPNTSSLTSGGALPGALAERMKSDLSQRFKPDSLKTVAPPDCGTITDIAVNSPILELTVTSAAANIIPQDSSEIASITMSSCPDDNGRRVPGVITTKVFKDGRPNDVVTKCGAAAPNNLTELELTNAVVPDWKARLLGTPGANTNILCIDDGNVCAPVNPGDMGTTIICDNDNSEDELLSNPVFDAATSRFIPDPNDRSCGKGWTGQMIARVQRRECTVTRNNGQNTIPGIVLNVGYVGAKCEKNEVLLEDRCPVGTPFEGTGKMITNKRLVMRHPVTLIPTQVGGVNVSSMAYDYIDPNTNLPETNVTTGTVWGDYALNLLGGTQTVTKAPTPGDPSTTMTANFFSSDANLNSIIDTYAFDSQFTTTLFNKLMVDNPTVTGCFALGQTCSAGDPIRAIAVVVDRSANMAMGGRPITPTQTSCRATIANLFKPGSRQAACVAAKTWQNIANVRDNIRDETMANWVAANEPVQEGTRLHDALAADAARYIDSGLRRQEEIMIDGLSDVKNVDRMKSALMRGQDCYPNVVQDDMYGSCAQSYASEDTLKGSNFGLTEDVDGNGPLLSCQSTCPGVCITDAVTRVKDLNGNGVVDGSEPAMRLGGGIFDYAFVPTNAMPFPDRTYLPLSVFANRMQIVDNFTRSNLLTNLPYGVNLYYSEFINNRVDRPFDPLVSRRPVALTLDNDLDPLNNTQNVDQTYWWKQVQERIKDKFDARGSYTGGNNPLYSSIDPSITNLIQTTLGANPNAPAGLVVMSNGVADPADRSTIFSNKFCEAPVDLPSDYQCRLTTRRCDRRILGFCIDWDYTETFTRIDLAAVRRSYGIEHETTRRQWCRARGNDDFQREVFNYPIPMVRPRGQKDSLVGIIGRNFPNTKIFYMGIDAGSLLAANCTGVRSLYTDPVTRRNRQVLYAFEYADNAMDQMYEAMGLSTGGGIPNEETGRQICELKYGVGVPIALGTPPGLDVPNLGFNNQALPPTCTVEYLDVDAPPGQQVVPPTYVPNPLFAPPGTGNPYSYPNSNCVPYGAQPGGGSYNGYSNDGLMTPCTDTLL